MVLVQTICVGKKPVVDQGQERFSPLPFFEFECDAQYAEAMALRQRRRQQTHDAPLGPARLKQPFRKCLRWRGLRHMPQQSGGAGLAGTETIFGMKLATEQRMVCEAVAVSN